MARQHFWKCGYECLLPYVLLFVLIFLCVPVTPTLVYKPVRFIISDLNGKPLEGAVVTLETIDTTLVLPPTDGAGITQSIEPIPQGTYWVTIKWKSQYRIDSSLIFSGNIQIGEPYIFELKANVFTITIKLVTPKGTPIKEAFVRINGREAGFTKDDGTLQIRQITAGLYDVEATWLGVEIGPGLVDIAPEGTQVIIARNVNQLTIVVCGAQGQRLFGATVRIKKAESEIMLKLTDRDGKVEVELPNANYSLEAYYGQFIGSTSVLLTKDEIKAINLDVFTEFLGVGMTMRQFLLFIVMIIIIVIVLVIVIDEYHIYRHKRLPQLFGVSGRKIILELKKRASIRQVTIDDIDSFARVRTLKSESSEIPKNYEEFFKQGLKCILHEEGKFHHWGGEMDDLFSTRLILNGERKSVAFGLKGRGTKGILTPKKMGKHGDQIQRLFRAPADVFIIQYCGQIHESVIEQMKLYAMAKSASEGRTIYYGVIDGKDTCRLIQAYKECFQHAVKNQD